MNRSSHSPYRNADSRSSSSSRSGGAYGSRSGGSSFYGDRPGGGRGGRRTSSPQGEFAMPVSTTPALPPVETFDELDMPKALLSVLTRQGVTSPFPIQAATLPNSLAGRDVLGRGRTGSGKTIAFGL
ncbi:DEAD/DEAH box helicase, partial [Kitasatospora sp. MBT63]|uniref:DEAD/DEAH box helicase n=1 Tax=Kitasatospora sp. MBT63 TaxID=1444768 RepID=UPI00053AB9BD